jgi:hypothetical protein
MKQLILAAFALTAAVGVFAQGNVFWQGYPGNGTQTQHVWVPSATAPYLSLIGNGSNDGPPGTTPYAESGMVLVGSSGTGGHWGSSTTFAQLLWANGANQPVSSLQPGGQTTTFRTGVTVGRINMINDTITGLTPDEAAATFEMVAWDNSSGLYPTWTQASVGWMAGLIGAGMSGAFNVYAIGGSVNTPPDVVAPSFNIYPGPEPSTFALVGLGLAALMIARRRK